MLYLCSVNKYWCNSDKIGVTDVLPKENTLSYVLGAVNGFLQSTMCTYLIKNILVLRGFNFVLSLILKWFPLIPSANTGKSRLVIDFCHRTSNSRRFSGFNDISLGSAVGSEDNDSKEIKTFIPALIQTCDTDLTVWWTIISGYFNYWRKDVKITIWADERRFLW